MITIEKIKMATHELHLEQSKEVIDISNRQPNTLHILKKSMVTLIRSMCRIRSSQ